MRFLPRRRKRSSPSEVSAVAVASGNAPELTVSVIVPVYNGEVHLGECVDSLLSQSYPGLEIILVDDGSTDSSGALCDDYASREQRVVALHRPNGGLSAARNTGLDAATGELVAFVDADDAVPPEGMALLVAAYLATKAPVVRGRELETEDIARYVSQDSGRVTIYPAGDAVAEALYQRGMIHSAWGAVYERRLWDEVRFRPGTWYEDLDVFYRIWLAAGEVAEVDALVYLYRQHPESFTHRFSERRADVLDVTDRMVLWIDRNCPRLSHAARCRRLSANINILGLIEAHGADMPEIAERCRTMIRRDGGRYGRDRRAKLSMRVAMTVMSAIGVVLLGRMLGVAYRKRR